jgi:dUTP pyrophosphatase
VVDPDYRGNIKVIVINNNKEPLVISPKDPIAQAVIECIQTPNVVEIEQLDQTKRGSGGFGSTQSKKRSKC